jgi:hypothetical protein
LAMGRLRKKLTLFESGRETDGFGPLCQAYPWFNCAG